MAEIIDNTYFEKGSLYIPNNKDLVVEPTGAPTIVTELDSFIKKYERKLLINALGVTLYDLLQVALAKLPFAVDTDPPTLGTADQKWIDLVNGKNYTNADGNVKRWNGLKGYDKQSVIAFYIFTEYLRNDNETYATVGTVKSDSKNATNVSATPKLIKANNEFIELYQGSSVVTQPIVLVNGFGSIGYDWFGSDSVEVSLLKYLLDSNEADITAFPDFEFKFYNNLNSFGI